VEKVIVDIPYRNLNKRIYYWGYKPMQLLIFAGTIAILLLICVFFSSGITGFIIGPVIAAPVFFIMGRVRKQNKNGVPDYAASMMLYFTSEKMIRDEGFVMNKLYRNKTGGEDQL